MNSVQLYLSLYFLYCLKTFTIKMWLLAGFNSLSVVELRASAPPWLWAGGPLHRAAVFHQTKNAREEKMKAAFL